MNAFAGGVAHNLARKLLRTKGDTMANRKQSIVWASLIAFSVASSAGQAQPALATAASSNTPSASLRILSTTSSDLRWFGSGDLGSTVQMCVTSTTGRYQLQVVTSDASMMPEGLNFEVTVKDGMTTPVALSVGGNRQLTFEGRVDPQHVCAGTANVTAELRFHQSTLQKAVAGQYLKNLQFSVLPL